MKILLTGATGGIGSAIKESLAGCEFFDEPSDVDWNIFAHGMIDENKMVDTFYVNTIRCMIITEAQLARTKQGFIYISSTAAIGGNSRFPVYSASKAALNTYCKAMAKKYPDKEFYSILPGPTNTKMWKSLGISGQAQEPSEVAKAVRMAMDGAFCSGDLIQVRNGIISRI